MANYRILIEYELDNGQYGEAQELYKNSVCQPSTLLDLGLRHVEQIELLRKVQDELLHHQCLDLQEDIENCPNCGHRLKRNGKKCSSFSSVFTDHKLPIHKLKCMGCGWESVPSIKSLFGTHLHPDLVKLQCEFGSDVSYAATQRKLNAVCTHNRGVNSQMGIRQAVETVGMFISDHPNKAIPQQVPEAKELIIQSDGGHIKSKIKGERSFEALASVVYRPEAIIPGVKKRESGTLIGKHCAASSLNDGGQHINELTLDAAKKEGLTKNTKVTALCDGASNCWNVIESLKPHCQEIDAILDWFHIAKAFQNARLRGVCKLKLTKAKWCLWHGDVDGALDRLSKIEGSLSSVESKNKIKKLTHYISNNTSKIVNYSDRYKSGKVITSQMAESTVESLINQRCKGKKHMQWSRDGLHPLLQIRASRASNDWIRNWESYVVQAYQKAA
jgi:hypothetical protein